MMRPFKKKGPRTKARPGASRSSATWALLRIPTNLVDCPIAVVVETVAGTVAAELEGAARVRDAVLRLPVHALIYRDHAHAQTTANLAEAVVHLAVAVVVEAVAGLLRGLTALVVAARDTETILIRVDAAFVVVVVRSGRHPQWVARLG